MDKCWQEMEKVFLPKAFLGKDNRSNQEIASRSIDQLKHITQQKEIADFLLKLVSQDKVIIEGAK